MRKKFSLGLLVMIVFISLGVYISVYHQFIGGLVIVGAIACSLMYFASIIEPNQHDAYMEEMERLEEEENKGI